MFLVRKGLRLPDLLVVPRAADDVDDAQDQDVVQFRAIFGHIFRNGWQKAYAIRPRDGWVRVSALINLMRLKDEALHHSATCAHALL